MELPARELQVGHRLEAEVCVVGAGPVGSTIARELADRGVDVVVLERGDSASGLEPVTDGVTLQGRRYPLVEGRARGVGGTSRKWKRRTALGGNSAQLPLMDPPDFELRPPGWSGWPIGFDEVERHAGRAASYCGLQEEHPVLPADSPIAVEGLEPKWFQSGSGRAFWRDGGGALLGHANIRVATGAYVLEVLADRGQAHVTGLRVASRPGREFTVHAGAYVLATGGIENARMLLASRDPDGPAIGNARDMVGRCFMEHPHYVAGYVVPRAREILRREPYFAGQVENGEARQLKYQLDANTRRENELPSVSYEFDPSPITVREGLTWGDHRSSPGAQAFKALLRPSSWTHDLPPGALKLAASALSEAPLITRAAAATAAGGMLRLVDRGPRLFKVRACAEQYPDPDSRVALTETRDEYGVPVAALRWRLTDPDLERLAASQREMARVLERGGVGVMHSSFDRPGWIPRIGVGFHHMGTTRMADSPRQGVVDRDSRVHGVNNLYVAGTSVFPTGGSANPTLTAVALAVRLAGHLAETLAPARGRAEASARPVRANGTAPC